MTATQQRRQRSWVMAAMHRTVDALRYFNDELVRANDAIFRPAGAPPGPPAGTSASSATTVTGKAEAAATGRTGRAA